MKGPGKGAARLVDVAREVGMSRGAVARVLLGTGSGNIRVSEASAKRIRAAAKRLKYMPNLAAQQLKGKGNRSIAAIAIDSAPAVTMERICAMERRAWEQGYDLVLCRTPYLPGRRMGDFLRRLRNRNVEGLVVLDKISQAQYDKQTNREFDYFTAVFHGYSICGDGDSGVLPDTAAGTRIATEHLVAKGYDRIGLAIMDKAPERLEAWREALRVAGLREKRGDAYLHTNYHEHKLPLDSAEAIVKRMVDKQKVNALVVENDYWAARVLQVLHGRGLRVPGDVAIIGYNNLDLTEFTTPQITTIDEDNTAIANALIDLLLEKIKGEAQGRDKRVVSITPRLVQRETT
ncbi:MAG: LacI family DNA-binding transcriptional regulator [Planctomycetota bacterium]|jgi:DNA-binding LacI/PurR family transcriptional regulator